MRHAMPPEPAPALEALDDALARAAKATEAPSRWRAPLAAVMFAAAVVVVAAVSSYTGARYAYQRSEAHTDQRIAVLESDLAQRRTAIAEANAVRDEQIAQLRAVVCVTLDHLQPRDGEVEQLRAIYGCAGGPYTLPPLGPTAPDDGATPRATPSTHRTARPSRIQPTRAHRSILWSAAGALSRFDRHA